MKTVYYLAILFFTSSFTSLPSRNSDQSHVLQFFEEELDVGGNIDRQFHVAAAANLQVPGYIIGIEKASKEALGFSGHNLKSYHNIEPKKSFWNICSDDDFVLYEDKNNGNLIDEELAKKLIADKKISYVSHINRYSYSDFNDPTSYVVNEYLVDSYSCKYDANKQICHHLNFRAKKEGSSCKYNSSKKVLIDLQPHIKKDLEIAKRLKKPYSHIILYSMGWNTTQREAIQNFNFLHGNLIRLAKEDKDLKNFNPLLIAITWPSSWSMESGDGFIKDWFIYPTRKLLSFFVKMHDADEIGDIWGQIFVNQTLLPLKSQYKDLKLVLIGHSFGARIVTNSLFSNYETSKQQEQKIQKPKADLLIGIQAAFPISRFVGKDKKELYFYQNLHNRAKNIIYTWSPYDYGVKIASVTGNYYVGSEDAYNKIATKHPKIFEELSLDSCSNFVNNNLFKKSDFQQECFDKKDQNYPQDSSKIIYLDAKKIINHRPEGSAGGAHSDIYNDDMSRFILNSIKHYAN